MKIKMILAALIISLGFTARGTQAAAPPTRADYLNYEKNTINVFRRNVKSVVNITNITKFKRRGTFSYETMEVPTGVGSGFVWDNKGHIVTNSHVVEGGDSFLVSFHKNKKQYKAKLVGFEMNKDIAVLQLIEKPKKLTPIQIGSSKNLMVGQKAMAIGNPFGLDSTITSGIVSALGRKIPGFSGTSIHNMIQTDCSINPGNSGGPLIDSTGSLIGMNTLIYSKSGSSSGIGFSVPVDTINRIVPQIIKHGKVIRPALGISLLDDSFKRQFGIKKGIVIRSVNDHGPAQKAGLQGIGRDPYGRFVLGDIILSIDGKKINNYDDIYNLLDSYKVGDKVKVKYLRDDKKKTTTLKLIPL